MADLTIPRGDKGFNLNFTIQSNSGGTVDLTTYSPVYFKVWPAGNTSGTTISGTCAISNATAGSVTYTIGSADFTTAKNYMGEIEITKSGVVESTKRFTIEITESA